MRRTNFTRPPNRQLQYGDKKMTKLQEQIKELEEASIYYQKNHPETYAADSLKKALSIIKQQKHQMTALEILIESLKRESLSDKSKLTMMQAGHIRQEKVIKKLEEDKKQTLNLSGAIARALNEIEDEDQRDTEAGIKILSDAWDKHDKYRRNDK